MDNQGFFQTPAGFYIRPVWFYLNRGGFFSNPRGFLLHRADVYRARPLASTKLAREGDRASGWVGFLGPPDGRTNSAPRPLLRVYLRRGGRAKSAHLRCACGQPGRLAGVLGEDPHTPARACGLLGGRVCCRMVGLYTLDHDAEETEFPR